MQTTLYNGLGQRVRKSGAAGTTDFVYDEAGRLLGEYDGNGAPVQETVWLGDLPAAVLKPGAGQVAVHYVYADHLNAPRVITRASDNQIVWRWDSADPFGYSLPDENPSGLGIFTYNGRFPGQYFDKETGLHYNYFRDCYDPATGRYCQPDPIGNVLYGDMASQNLFSAREPVNARLSAQLFSESPVYNHSYAYVENNPVSKIDPDGLQACMMTPAGPVCTILPPPGGYPPGINYPPKSPVTDCYVEQLPPKPPKPPKPDCEAAFDMCTRISRTYGGLSKIIGYGACVTQYLICKKVIGGGDH